MGENKSRIDVWGVVAYADIDWFVIVEVGVLLLESIPLTLLGPFPFEGAGMDSLDPHGVYSSRFELRHDYSGSMGY